MPTICSQLNSCLLASYRVLGAVPLGERVARNEVRAQGETSPSLYLKPNAFQVFLYLFFEVVAFCEQCAELGCEAFHFVFERFVVCGAFFDSDVAAWG